MIKSRTTSAIEKSLASILNVLIVGIIYLPFHFTSLKSPSIFIIFFFIYNIFVLVFNKNRCIGMVITKTYWAKKYSFISHSIYTILYTISFSTIFIWIYFPFDIFILNLVFLQLPFIFFTKTTVHGFFSGNLVTIKYLN